MVANDNTDRFDHSAHMVRSGVLQHFDLVLSQFDISATTLYEEFGLSSSLFDDGDVLIDLAIVGRLLERAVKKTGARHFPILLAAQQDAQFIGALWPILQSSNTLGEALTDISQYIYIHAQPVTWSVVTQGGRATIAVGIDGAHISPSQRELLVDLALCQYFKVLCALTGERVKLEQVTVHYAALQTDRHHRRFFGTKLVFDAGVDGLIIAAKALSTAIDHSDTTALHNTITRQLDDNDSRNAVVSLDQEVRAIIRSLLPMQQCRVEQVASLYGCDKRTLQRHLQAECGVSYQFLLDQTRYETACQYLQNSSLPLTQIAAVVGFREPSNFARGFKQFVGVSPSAWRAQHQSQPNGIRRRLRLRQTPH